VLEAAPFDGRELKDLLKLIREPIPEFMILGGMMVNQEDVLHLLNMLRSFRSFAHSVRILARHALDRLRYPRGTRLMMGNALVRAVCWFRCTGKALRFCWVHRSSRSKAVRAAFPAS